MNNLAERTRAEYRCLRERTCYSIFDIESSLKTLSEEGLIWCLQGMPDLSDTEEILISHFLTMHQNLQLYDNL